MKRIVLMISGIIVATCVAYSQGPLIVNITEQDNPCNGQCNGRIYLTVSGGVQPYTYSWSNGETIEDLIELCDGFYTVTVSDADTNTFQCSAEIKSPSAITVLPDNHTVCCSSTTSISPSVTGGTPPYLNYWNYVQLGTTLIVNTCVTMTYIFFVIDAQNCSSDTIPNTLYIEYYPPSAQITINGSEIYSNSFCGNQWYFDTDSIPDVKSQSKGLTSTLITGATAQQYTPTETGYYFDVITDNDNNELISNVVFFTYNSSEIVEKNNSVLIYPNPAYDKLNIDIDEKATLEIINSQGQIVDTKSLTEKVNNLDLSNLVSGVYTLRIKTDRGIAMRKLIKQ